MTDIFESQGATTPDNDDTNAARQQADIFVEKLLEIKREDGSPKYESVEDALDALKASQEHIRRIEAENAEYKTKAAESDQLKETLARLENKEVNKENPSDKTNTNGGLSEEAARELIRKQLQEEKTQETLVNNVKTVQDTLISKLGSKEKAQEFVVKKAKELGMSPEALKQLSASSPNAALALLGEAVKPSSNVNTSTTRLPLSQPDSELKAPEVSILSGRGATSKNQTDFAKRVRERVYKRMNVENV